MLRYLLFTTVHLSEIPHFYLGSYLNISSFYNIPQLTQAHYIVFLVLAPLKLVSEDIKTSKT